jgi:hypothetical protein
MCSMQRATIGRRDVLAYGSCNVAQCRREEAAEFCEGRRVSVSIQPIETEGINRHTLTEACNIVAVRSDSCRIHIPGD